MSKPKIDPSLTEVREWRESLGRDLADLSPEAKIEKLNRLAQPLIEKYNLKTGGEAPAGATES